MSTEPYEILLYYKYVSFPDPPAYFEAHKNLCSELDLRGRILIAKEGINGTVSGPVSATTAYRNHLDNDPLTSGIAWKIDPADGHAFPKMSVKFRKEVVTLGLGEDDFSPEEITATHLSPPEWREAMKDKDTVVIDARNDYEWKLGRFEGAILPEVANFRELPEWIRRHRDELAGKKILTYCTGGIRCEKFSGFLLREGFKDVYQLDGGIVTYGKHEETKGEGFEGECYVFDERISVPVNRTPGARIVSHCSVCNEPCARYINCAWKPCNAQFFCCESCQEDVLGYCGDPCRQAATIGRAADHSP